MIEENMKDRKIFQSFKHLLFDEKTLAHSAQPDQGKRVIPDVIKITCRLKLQTK